MDILFFIIGLFLLIIGAEWLVKGASKLASSLKISPLIIGLTVVAFGTSAPELAVSIKSSLTGQEAIALGNIVGSNIFNVLFILGIAALILPLTVSKQLLRLDVPLMIVLSIVVFLFSLNGVISKTEGIILVLGLLVYIFFLIYQNRKDNAAEPDRVISESKSGKSMWAKNIILVIVGLALLMVGSQWFLNGAIMIAQYFGVSELIIGLTIVAAGTSLPEVVTSVLAAIRGERDIAVGNVVGSNIFNLLSVLGISALVAPGGLEISASFINFDLPVMIAVAFACLPIFFTGGVISRGEGALLLGYYVVYTLYLILAATQHASLPILSTVLIYFVLPLTMIVLLMVVMQQFRRRR
ncbi:MAG: calcium/sodium antiporter [Balneolaceae bacterium]